MNLKFIAEIGNNHGGDIELAKKMIDTALEAKADYVKFQIYNIDKFIAKGNAYYDELKSETLSFDDFEELKQFTDKKGGHFLATPFDLDSLNLLNKMRLSAIKIASGDLTNMMLIEKAVGLGKALLISTGGADITEIDRTVTYLKQSNADYCLLHCIIDYPAAFNDLNLNFIRILKQRYGCKAGYSDHSLSIEASLAAIALGADVIEKHFTIDRNLQGGDNEMSILPHEFNQMVRMGKNIQKSLGSGERILSNGEKITKKLIRRKIFACRSINKNQIIVEADLVLLRPVDPEVGIDAAEYLHVIGKTARKAIQPGQLISRNLIDGFT